MPRPNNLALTSHPEIERWVGRRLAGRFDVLRFLGRGGMASVYEAENTTMRSRVALKILEPSARLSKDHERRFLREARATARIRHPNVVAVHDIEVDRITSAVFMVQELLEGDDLRALLRGRPDGRLSLEETLAWMVPIAEALEAAHDAGIVHCDVTPSNVYIAQQHGVAVPKLIDFGVARRLEREARTSARERALRPILGTPQYMAPEQARGEAVGPGCDVWSFGAVLYRCVTGRAPFEAAHPSALLAAIEGETYVPVHELVDLPLEVATLIDRALEPDRARRFASMSDVLHALRGTRTSSDLQSWLARERLASTRAPANDDDLALAPPPL